MKKNRFSNFMQEYREEIQRELKNNSIVLSFAIAILLIGFFSCFYDTGNGLLIGISIATFLLTIIQCFSNGNTMLNILPIFTLLLFGFFQKSMEHIPVIRLLLEDNLRNFLIFLAFSLSFITQAYKNILYRHSLKVKDLVANDHKNKMMLAQLSTDQKMIHLAENVKNVAENRGVTDYRVTRAIDELIDYIDSESFVTSVKSNLILKGSHEKKSTFDVEEVEETILMSNGVKEKVENAPSKKKFDFGERHHLSEKNNRKSLDETEPEEDPFDFDFKFH